MVDVPTPDFFSPDLGDGAIWTFIGSSNANLVDGQCGTNKALDFDGSDDGLERKAGAVITSGASMSCAVWNQHGSLSEQGTLIGQFVSMPGQSQYIFRTTTAGAIDLIILDSGGVNTLSKKSVATYSDNVKRYFGARVIAGVIDLFVNGVKLTSTTLSGPGFTSFGGTAAPLRLGIRGDGANKMDGILDRPKAWIAGLTDEEMTQDYINALICDLLGDPTKAIDNAYGGRALDSAYGF